LPQEKQRQRWRDKPKNLGRKKVGGNRPSYRDKISNGELQDRKRVTELFTETGLKKSKVGTTRENSGGQKTDAEKERNRQLDTGKKRVTKAFKFALGQRQHQEKKGKKGGKNKGPGTPA